jgi:hypothetical protein
VVYPEDWLCEVFYLRRRVEAAKYAKESSHRNSSCYSPAHSSPPLFANHNSHDFIHHPVELNSPTTISKPEPIDRGMITSVSISRNHRKT